MNRKLVSAASVAFLMVLFGVGCAQHTAAPIDQMADQELTTPTTTEQDSAAQGSQVFVYVINAPGKNGLPDASTLELGGEADPIESLVEGLKTADGTEIERTGATFAQAGFTITVNTGDTTPSLTGTATGSASGSQAPTAYPTVSPYQDIKPEASVSVPVGFAPGGVIDQQAIATGKGQTSDTGKTSENELRWAELLADPENAEKLGPLLELIDGVLGNTDESAVEAAETPAPAE